MEAYQSFDVPFLTNKEKNMLLKHAEKIAQVKDVIMQAKQDSLKTLELVDTIQRLGLSHLFKDQIEAILHHQYFVANETLFEASLRFRLLRQHGYEVIADDFFGHFVRCKGGATGGPVGEMRDSDVMAMYEASHLNMGGEEIMYEAAIFSSHYLNRRALTCVEEDKNAEAKMIKYCMMHPQHKSLTVFTARNYLDFVINSENNHLLQELAELEFLNIKSMHKQEIIRVAEWWEGVGLSKELKFSRNQPLKWHMWSMATLSNPSWSKHRILLTKPISLVYVVDDIFDLYGTIYELTLFTQAVGKWDASASNELPSYMKTCFSAIYDTTNEISSVVIREHGWNPIELLKKEWGSLMEAFLVEAKWLRSGELPKASEYLENGVVSSGVPMVLSHLFCVMGNPLTNQTHLLLNDPHGLTHSVAKLLRLLDDLSSDKLDGLR